MINFIDNSGIIEVEGLGVVVNEYPEKFTFWFDAIKEHLTMVVQINPAEKIYWNEPLTSYSFEDISATDYEDCEAKIEAMFHKHGTGGGGGGTGDLQSVTDLGSVTDNNVTLADLFLKGSNGLKFNIGEDTLFIQAGYGAVIFFDKVTGNFDIHTTVNSGAAGDTPLFGTSSLILKPDGTMTFGGSYGSGFYDGAINKLLGVDVDGKLLTISGVLTLDKILSYGATLSQARTIDAGAFNFNILNIDALSLTATYFFLDGKLFVKHGSSVQLSVIHDDFSEDTILQSNVNLNISRISVHSDDNTAETALEADFNDNTKIARITLTANNSSGTIQHSADQHNFDGKVIGDVRIQDDFVDDDAANVGGIIVGQKYHNAGAVRLRLA